MDVDGPSTVALATGSADTQAKLWTRSGRLLHVLAGHTDRLARVAFHPFGRHLATASFDTTWRLWDVETGVCLLEQEGHSRPVYAVAFQPDGSLAASVGLDAVGRVWDCRTGRNVWMMQGHVKQVSNCALLLGLQPLVMDEALVSFHCCSGNSIYRGE